VLSPGSVVGGRYQIVRAAPSLLLLVALTAVTRAADASPTSRLVYVRGAGAESCPDEAEMRRAVATRLGYDPFRSLAQTTLTAEIHREKGVFRGRVKLVDDAGVERGARDLESRADDCSDLTTAMALSMSIAIDPLSVLRPPPKVEEPSAAAEPPSSPPASSPPSSLPPPSAPPAVDRPTSSAPSPDVADPARFALAAGGHVAFGIAPAPALGFRVSGEIATRRFAVGLEGRLDLPASSESSEGGRSRTSLAGAALVPCVRVPLAWACGVLLASRVDAEAISVTAPRSDAFLFFGAGARLVTAIPLPEGFNLRIGGDALVHPVPFELTLNGRRIYRSSVVSAIAGVAVARIF
jgi:hypothetical protein